MEHSPDSYGNKVTQGALWTIAMRTTVRLIGLFSVIILARLLTPEDFGVVAKAVLIYGLLEEIVSFGLENALIRDQHASKAHYDTVWTFQILRGSGIATVLCLLAVPAARFFQQPQLDQIIYVYAAISFLAGFINVGTVDFRKEFQFKKDFAFTIARRVGGFLVTVSVALAYQTYWALVFGALASMVIAVILSYGLSPYRPQPTLLKWREMLGFSSRMTGAAALGSLAFNMDTLILSRFSSTHTLGLYTVSNELSHTISADLAMPVARALMPGLSKVNHDKAAFRDLNVNTLSVVLFLTLPLSFGLSVIAEPATALLLGIKWVGAGDIVQILALCGGAAGVSAMSVSGYLSFNQVDAYVRVTAIHLGLRGICLPLGFFVAGTTGLAWGVLIAVSLYAGISIAVQQRLGIIDVRILLHNTWRALMASIGMYVILSILLIETARPSTTVALNVGFGGCVFTAMLAALWFASGRPSGPESTILIYMRNVTRNATSLGNASSSGRLP